MSSGLRSGAGFRMSTAAGQRKWSVAVQRDAGAGGHGSERVRTVRWRGDEAPDAVCWWCDAAGMGYRVSKVWVARGRELGS